MRKRTIARPVTRPIVARPLLPLPLPLPLLLTLLLLGTAAMASTASATAAVPDLTGPVFAPGPGQPPAVEVATPWNLPWPNRQERMQLLGHWPNGQTYGVYPLGDTLYAGCGASLVALDVTDPTGPVPVGRLELPGTAIRITAFQQEAGASPARVAYVYVLPDGIVTVDVSDPRAMRALDFFPTVSRANQMVQRGSLLYCALSGEGLAILDVSDPAHVQEVGRYSTEGSVLGLLLSGDLAYLAYGSAGLVTLDISDPAAPRELARTQSPFSPQSCRKLCLVGDHLFTCEFSHVVSWDLTDPAAPALAGSVELANGLNDMTCEGTRVFVAGSGLFEVDASDPSAPALVWRTEDNAACYSPELRDDRLTLVRYGGYDGAPEVEIFDVSVPGSLLGLGYWDDGGLLEDARRRGDLVYSMGHNDGVRALDVSDPAAITTRGQILLRSPYNGALIDSVLWVGNLRGLAGVNVNDPENLVPSGIFADYRMSNLAVRGDTIVAVGPVAGVPNFRVLDVAQPAQPTLVSNLRLPGMGLDVALRGHYALVCGQPWPWDGTGILQVVDLADPTAPVLVRTERLPGTGRGLALADTLAYVVCADSSVHVFDVAAPAQASQVAVVPTDLDLRGIELAGDRLYLLSTSGITSMALDDPLAPVEVAAFECAMVQRLDVQGTLLTAASYEAGVWLLRDLSHEPEPVARLALAARPNPFQERTAISLAAPRAGRYEVRLFDLRGRLVRRLFEGELEAGPREFEWDGRDADGRRCAAGGYVVRVSGPAGAATRAVTLLR